MQADADRLNAVPMSGPEYEAYRRRETVLFALRVACAAMIIYIWDDLDTLEKVVAIAMAAVVVPGLISVRKLFMSYERYLRDFAAAGEAKR